MTSSQEAILALFDAGQTPVQIITAGHTKRVVYAVLRKERPGRTRAPRRRSSLVRPKVLALHKAGMAPGRISALLGCSAVWVYRLLQPPKG